MAAADPRVEQAMKKMAEFRPLIEALTARDDPTQEADDGD